MLRELLESSGFGQSEKAEGVSIQSMSFQRTDHDRVGEAPPDPSGLCWVEAPAPTSRHRLQLLHFGTIGIAELVHRESAGVANPAKYHQSAHFEAPREAREGIGQVFTSVIFLP